MKIVRAFKVSTFVNDKVLSTLDRFQYSGAVSYTHLDDSSDADAEMLALTIECLLESGLKEFQIEVGPVSYTHLDVYKRQEYLSYRDELRNLDINVFLQDYKENSASMEELREKESIADGDLAKTKEEYETVKTEYIQLEEALDKHTRNLEECRETLSADKVKLNQQEGDIKVLEEQINACLLYTSYLQPES